MEDSPLGLDKWLTAVWLIVNCKNGISSTRSPATSASLRSPHGSWITASASRLHDGSFEKLSGQVEADETFIGGKARNMHVAQRKRRITGTGGKDKTAVMGILERGKARARFAPTWFRTARRQRFRPKSASTSRLVPRSTPMRCYRTKDWQGLRASGRGPRRGVRGRQGTHQRSGELLVAAEARHQRNLRQRRTVPPVPLSGRAGVSATTIADKEMNDFDRFKLAASQIVGKRLTWNEATGKNHEPQTYPN